MALQQRIVAIDMVRIVSRAHYPFSDEALLIYLDLLARRPSMQSPGAGRLRGEAAWRV